MSTELFDFPGVCRASFDARTGVTVHEWFDYNPPYADKLVFEILERIYVAFCENGSTKVLVIANNTKGAFSREVLTFIRDVQFPRLATDTKLKFVATVLPREALPATYATLWKEQRERNERFILADFASLDEATDWLLEQD